MNSNRAAKILTFLFAIALLGAPVSFASDKSDVVEAVHRYLANLDPDKLQTALAMCDVEHSSSIVDEFQPSDSPSTKLQ
jgi:hypothetical protein